ncbi:MAG TPA: O-antigen ligase family protein [Opitutaceae bacterium]|nr:O-antigen ligase family protein [Opitutaceae bacterium]
MNGDPVRSHAAFEWARVALLTANLAWTTLCLGGFLPGTRVWMAALTGALIAVHLVDPSRGTRAHAAGWLFAPFLAYAAANTAWVTPVRWLGWTDWLNWAQAVAVFWVVLNGVAAPACRRFLCAFLAALGVLAAALACYQHFVKPDWLMLGRTQAAQFIGRSSGPFGIPNSLGVLMALLIPPVGALAVAPGRPAALRALGAAALCALAAGFVLAISRGAWIALALAFALKPLLTPGRSIGRRIAAAAAAAASAFAVAAVCYFSFPLMRARVDQLVRNAGELSRPVMWRGAWKIFEAHPVFGGGAGSYDALFEAYRPEGNLDQPTYAHCDYLNTLSDYGAVGFVLLFGAAGTLAWRCARARGLAGAAFTGLLAFALHLSVDFHLKIPALAMIVATVAALVTGEAWPRAADHPEGAARPLARAAALLLAAAAIGATVLWIIPRYQADESRRLAREKIDGLARSGADVSREREAVAGIRARLDKAVALDPSNAQAWSDRAYADSLWALVNPARTAELGADAARDAGRAVDLCPVVSEFWIRRGVGLDMQGRWLEAGACFTRALELAPSRTDCWYYEAYHLSLSAAQVSTAMAAADHCLRLDPSYLLAQALRQRLATSLRQHQ